MIIVTVFAFGIPNEKFFMGSAAVLAITLFILSKDRWLFGTMVAFVLALFPLGFYWGQHSFTDIVHRDRNFFGVIKVVDTTNNERVLLHGTTNHGAQALVEEYRLTPLSYYSHKSPINDVFSYYNKKPGEQTVAILGLGIGVTACFSKEGRHFDFFEIDAEIAEIAKNEAYFTYLSECGSPYDIILGDGRLTVANKPDKHYDILVADAFSSDNVPIHIMTQEALALYLSKIKDDGAVIMNISNNYIDLEPVVAKTAKALGLTAIAKVSNGGEIEGTDIEFYPAHFIILSRNEDLLKKLRTQEWTDGMFRDGVKAWSDQYSNIVSVLGNKIAIKRFKEQIGSKMEAEEAEKTEE